MLLNTTMFLQKKKKKIEHDHVNFSFSLLKKTTNSYFLEESYKFIFFRGKLQIHPYFFNIIAQVHFTTTFFDSLKKKKTTFFDKTKKFRVKMML